MSSSLPVPQAASDVPNVTHTWHQLASKVPRIPSNRAVKVSSVLEVLKVSADIRAAIKEHGDAVGYDCRRFGNSIEEQDEALQLLIEMGAHIPEEIDRDAQSKLAIRFSDHHPLQKQFTRWQRVYQCMCGTDNEQGHQPNPKSAILTVDEIVGHFTHSDECLSLTEMEKKPAIPLHPDLRSHALSLLRIRVPLAQLKQLCRDWAQARWGSAIGDASFRYILNNHETTFRLILTTPEQRLLAWRYGHKKQVLMDLTFGICSGRLLLVIFMAIDEDNHGVPITRILFSARKSAKAVHADYNGKLLDGILADWKTGMGTNDAGEQFEMCVGSTDNDPRERFAIQKNWAFAFLLLCIFHTWQAWRNGLNKHLRQIPEKDDRQEIRSRLGKKLLSTRKPSPPLLQGSIEEARQYFEAESKGGLAFLTYLQSYLRLRSFWESWSLAGAIEAGKRMGIPVAKVARTTNHLESYNGRLKGKFFAHHMRSGRLPRVDYWVLVLITEALPTFFAEWQERRERERYYINMKHAPAPSTHLHVVPRSRQLPPINPQAQTSINVTTPAMAKPASVQEAISRATEWVEKVLGKEPGTTAVDNTSELPDGTERLLEQLEEDYEAEDEEPEDEDSEDAEPTAVAEELVISSDGDTSFPAVEPMELDSDDSDDETDDSLVSMVVKARSDVHLDSSASPSELPDVSYSYDLPFEPPSPTMSPSPPSNSAALGSRGFAWISGFRERNLNITSAPAWLSNCFIPNHNHYKWLPSAHPLLELQHVSAASPPHSFLCLQSRRYKLYEQEDTKLRAAGLSGERKAPRQRSGSGVENPSRRGRHRKESTCMQKSKLSFAKRRGPAPAEKAAQRRGPTPAENASGSEKAPRQRKGQRSENEGGSGGNTVPPRLAQRKRQRQRRGSAARRLAQRKGSAAKMPAAAKRQRSEKASAA
ncbi:hypothetical protein B0H11DRAFT_2378902 [Mycena galericulata]|nr:hypothetical protein B0H11DRAFT_2378902 [Mycena galericulata]